MNISFSYRHTAVATHLERGYGRDNDEASVWGVTNGGQNRNVAQSCRGNLFDTGTFINAVR